MQFSQVDAKEDVLVQLIAWLYGHEQHCHVDSCQSDPHEECEGPWSELGTEGRLPHIPVAFLPGWLANVVSTAAGQAPKHAHRLFTFLIHGSHAAHALLLIADGPVGRPRVVTATRVRQRVYVRHLVKISDWYCQVYCNVLW